jgi:hypothetical protein
LENFVIFTSLALSKELISHKNFSELSGIFCIFGNFFNHPTTKQPTSDEKTPFPAPVVLIQCI